MRILVTGATGLGIIDRPRDEGHSVIGASRQLKEDAGQRLDITDPIACQDMLIPGKYDTVMHGD